MYHLKPSANGLNMHMGIDGLDVGGSGCRGSWCWEGLGDGGLGAGRVWVSEVLVLGGSGCRRSWCFGDLGVHEVLGFVWYCTKDVTLERGFPSFRKFRQGKSCSIYL